MTTPTWHSRWHQNTTRLHHQPETFWELMATMLFEPSLQDKFLPLARHKALNIAHQPSYSKCSVMSQQVTGATITDIPAHTPQLVIVTGD
jgi:hypothetical protein